MSTHKVYEPNNVDYKNEAIDRLRELFPMHSEVRTIVKHVARSGMVRSIVVLAVDDGKIVDVTYNVARVVGWSIHDTGGVWVNGCGMDMQFHVVYTLSRILYQDAVPTGDAGYMLTSRPL